MSESIKKAPDAEFIKPFLTGVLTTMGVQASTPLTPEKPYVKSIEHKPDIAIAAVININSKLFKGSVALSFSKEVFLNIYKNMIGEEHIEITPDTQDACGELLNIIYGAAKAELNNKLNAEISPAIPTVISGDKMYIKQTTKFPVIVIPFKTAAGYFYLELVKD